MFTLALGLVGSAPAVAAEVHVPFCGITPISLAGAIPNCTFTQNIHGATATFDTTVPCVDPPGSLNTGTLTITYNAVFHVAVNGAGDIWVTGTQEGDFSFIPFDPNRPSYTGHFAAWFGFSLNQKNAVFHDTFNVHGIGSDGSILTAHFITHMSFNANGIALVFDKFVC
jgi:hypothetical protein